MPSVRSSDAPESATHASSPVDAASAWVRFGAVGDLLRRVVAGGRVAPAYLFEASDLSVPREAATVFAQALLCRQGVRPCLVCSACRRVRSGNHPDVHRQGRDKATVISVEALGALLERAHASPLEGDRQVFIVQPAEAMAPEAIARYLKTLEEPPPTTTFVLVTARPDRLPATVRSRCQRLRFPSPTDVEVEAGLLVSGIDPIRATRFAAWALGSPSRARRLAHLDADLVIDAICAAGFDRRTGAATTAEALLATLRVKAPETETEDADEHGATPEGAAGEALRRALDDLFHALQAMSRLRVAGLAGGPLGSLSPDRAAWVLERWARLAGHVRRNVSPMALLIESVGAVRRARGAGGT